MMIKQLIIVFLLVFAVGCIESLMSDEEIKREQMHCEVKGYYNDFAPCYIYVEMDNGTKTTIDLLRPTCKINPYKYPIGNYIIGQAPSVYRNVKIKCEMKNPDDIK